MYPSKWRFFRGTLQTEGYDRFPRMPCKTGKMAASATKEVHKYGKTWWRLEASTTLHHLKNWKESRHNFHVKELMEQDRSAYLRAFSFHNVMLWVVASLLTMVEDVLSEEDNKESQSNLQSVFRQPSWSSAEDLEQEGSIHIPWSETSEEWPLMQKDKIQHSRWRRSPHDPTLVRMSRRNRKKTKTNHDCHLQRKEMRVRDLGLGYDSDEIILFKYCVGTCHSSRKNYDLALKALVDNGSISDKKVSSHPCCRPTRYETVSFMNTQTTWQTIKWLSAANCSCMG
ncbi:LOW QUALITY PROTEIN: uncharacterized protein artn [Chaetodon auriga]|uniref:LOW QUALITY PROTEIN: uncharacterized protein artn n=1 Tax=Chaetodon auriga TaxID=39042 RepID=UPI004032E78C